MYACLVRSTVSYNSAELKALMTLHHESSEASLLHGALDFKHGVVGDVITPMDEVCACVCVSMGK